MAAGKQALDALEQGNFDAIVTDAHVPRLAGIELVRPLHESGSYTPVIIFVSGFVGLTLQTLMTWAWKRSCRSRALARNW